LYNGSRFCLGLGLDKQAALRCEIYVLWSEFNADFISETILIVPVTNKTLFALFH